MYKASVKERKHLENGGVEPPKTHSSIKAMRTLTKKVNIKFSELYKLTKGTMIQEVFIQEKWLILSKKGALCDAPNWPITTLFWIRKFASLFVEHTSAVYSDWLSINWFVW